jgi:Cytochrome P460
MTIRKTFALAFLAAIGASAIAVQVRAGGDKVAFPENFAQGVMYTTVDRADNKQYRELFVTPPAVEAAKKGEPLPSGTVITIVQYKAQLDAQGNPAKDANGRFLKGDLIGYGVMEKRTGWGAEYSPEIRNGEWEYQAFTADKKVNDKANLIGCFQCHKPLPSSQDFVFSYGKMAAFPR